MKEKIFTLLDDLVTMSGSEYSTESLNLELDEIESKILSLTKKIEKETADESKYFDIASQMVDKNIEICLIKRIKDVKNQIDEISKKISESLKKEEENHILIKENDKQIKIVENLILAFNKKYKISKNENYMNLIKIEENNLKQYQQKNNNLLKIKSQLNEELSGLSITKEELENKLTSETEKLTDTQNNLANDKNYYNYNAKKDDENYLSELNEELKLFEQKRLELLTNSSNLANEAKKLIVSEKWVDAISKIRELLTVIKDVPYISEKDSKFLNQEIDKVKNKISSKKAEISNKKYYTEESNVYSTRIAYLNDVNQELTTASDVLNNLINTIDNNMLMDLKDEIEKTKGYKKTLENNIKDLELLLEENNSVDILASLVASKKELINIDTIIEKENKDLEYFANYSLNLEKIGFEEINNKIAENIKESDELEKKSSLKVNIKDEKAKNKDNKEIQELEKELNYLENSLKFTKTPDEIYNEIDCLLGSLDFDEPIKPTRTSRYSKNAIENKLSEEKYEFGIENKKPIINDFEPVIKPVLEETKINIAPEEKIKIVKIIPVNTKQKKEESKLTNKPLEKESEEMNFNDIINFVGDN